MNTNQKKQKHLSEFGALAQNQFHFLYANGLELSHPLSNIAHVQGCKIGDDLKIANFGSGTVYCPRDYLQRFIAQGSEIYGTALKLLEFKEFLIVADNIAKVEAILGNEIKKDFFYWIVKDGNCQAIHMRTGEIYAQVERAGVILKM